MMCVTKLFLIAELFIYYILLHLICEFDLVWGGFRDFLSQSINQQKWLVIRVIPDSYYSVNKRGLINERSYVVSTHFSRTS